MAGGQPSKKKNNPCSSSQGLHGFSSNPSQPKTKPDSAAVKEAKKPPVVVVKPPEVIKPPVIPPPLNKELAYDDHGDALGRSAAASLLLCCATLLNACSQVSV
ncbi:hypothetical protein KSP40_PGU019080 [Platanthera guangdongensis]|uniref:Uncharacterized protein n=1 Tax=Platanthera guangdongensis TaxID=2320717 RepID=A0ABR2LC38_9ASPA